MSPNVAVMTATTGQIEDELEAFRGELTGYCYRMLGCPVDAQDAVQDTMLRAWRATDSFQGKSSVRTWIYRIATNVCLDARRAGKRRASPMDLGPSSPPVLESLGTPRPSSEWVLPMPTAQLTSTDPAQVSAGRDDVRLAFIAALQQLAPRQRAVLILCEVLRFSAAEVADLLDASTASVNSALQRARTTLAAHHKPAPAPLTRDLAGLLARYVSAFERYDIDALVALMREDVVMNMPPFPLWLRGPANAAAWLVGPGAECRGSRLVATSANGQPAFGQYRSAPGGGHAPWALIVLDVCGDRLATMSYFLDTQALFPRFGLPISLP